MPKAHDNWTVLSHGPIEKLAENLWRVEGAIPDMKLKRAMTIARMQDGRLLIHNAIALDAQSMAEIDAWGEPAAIVVPNGWHRLDCLVYHRRYPRAELYCPAGSRKKVEKVVQVSGTYDDFAGDETVQLRHVDGLRKVEGVLLVQSGDGLTLVFNDLLFNLPHGHGVTGLVFRLLGSTGGPKVTRIMRVLAVKDRRALRANLEALAAEPQLSRLIPGHGRVVDRDASTVLRDVAATL